MNQMLVVQKDYTDKTLQEAKDFYHKIKSIYDNTAYSKSYQLGRIWESDSQNLREIWLRF